jgi:hypothetical protein
MHGGAQGSGAPRGNKNALKHGLYTREAIAERRHLQNLMRQSRQMIKEIHNRRDKCVANISGNDDCKARAIASKGDDRRNNSSQID